MADLLSTGVSGLLAFQRALDTTSHNIANASTVGYSRQTTEFTTREANQSGSGWIGNGVDVATVKRNYDDFLASQVRSSSSSLEYLDTYATQTERVNNLFGDSSTGLSASLQDFIDSAQALADTPTSTPTRQTLLSQAESLVSRLQSYDDSLSSLNAEVDAQLDSEVDAINSLASSIASLNQQIASGYALSGQPPNDLLDQRDRLLDELATHTNVSVVEQGDHSVNVFIGNGQPLVVGQTANQLATFQDPYDATRKLVGMRTGSAIADVTPALTGGSLGGILAFRTEVLDPARNELGLMSLAIADAVNSQQAAGVDLNGEAGAALFGVGEVLVQPRTGNTGIASLGVTRTDIGALTGADYLLSYTASGWQMQRADTGAAVAMTGTGTSADPFVADGLEIVVTGTAQAGDQFRILPTQAAVADMKVLIDDPAQIAAAAPMLAQADTGNTGSATITEGEVIDPTNADLRSTVTIEFTSATSYTINGAGPNTYTAGADLDVNGWRVQISGTPAVGDSFTVAANTNGTGDNRNALKLAEVLDAAVLNGGTTSLSDAIGQFVSEIGVKTNQAQTGRDAQQVVYDESVESQQSLSGVNLDEEAADLLKYQQYYAAMAQVIAIAGQLFDTLIDATRG